MKNMFARRILLFGLLWGSSVALIPVVTPSPKVQAQTEPAIAFGLNEAKNLARQAAEQANGGLGSYRAEPAMHGDPQLAPYVENTDGSYTFTFKGRDPNSLDYTYETQVTVFPDETARIDYNGNVRSGQAATAIKGEVELNQAKNLARQAAEQLNGGLGNYRAEAAMHGDALRSPYERNADGSYTFTFKGRNPVSTDYAYETEIRVTKAGQTEVIYNGEPRQTMTTATTTTATVDLNQAKNLARQAAEQANGGLGSYRAEPSMHGNPNESPFVENADGSYTFTFQGRRPESLDYTYATVVTVYSDGRVELISNQANP